MIDSFFRGVSKKTIVALFAVDLLFVVATAFTGALAVSGVLETIPALVNVGRDWSLPEAFNYLKWLVLALIFFFAYRQDGHPLLLSLASIFLLLMFDDSLQLHEQFGRFVSDNVDGQEGFHAYVQIGYWIILASGFLILLRSSYLKAPKPLKQAVAPMLVPFLGLVFFGVFLDFLHSALTEDGTLSAGLLILLEDGGELFMISSLVAYAVNQWKVPFDHLGRKVSS